MRKKKKYYVIYCVKEQDVFNILKKRRIRGSNQVVRFRKGTYVINISFPTYVKGLRVFYFIDIKKGQQLAKNTEIAKGHILFKENAKDKALISPQFLDMFISQKIVGQLTSNLSDNAMKMNIITLIFGAIMGGLVGYIIAGVI